ncbi:MAG: hypothetical protein R3C97_01875 [Geminicoccaceae bacterium]
MTISTHLRLSPPAPDAFALRARFLGWSPVRMLRFCWMLACGRVQEAAILSNGMTRGDVSAMAAIWPVSAMVDALSALRKGPVEEALLHAVSGKLRSIVAGLWRDRSEAARARMLWIKRVGRHRLELAAERLCLLLLRRIRADDRECRVSDQRRMMSTARPGGRPLPASERRARRLLALGRELLIDDLAALLMEDLVVPGTAATAHRPLGRSMRPGHTPRVFPEACIPANPDIGCASPERGAPRPG